MNLEQDPTPTVPLRQKRPLNADDPLLVGLLRLLVALDALIGERKKEVGLFLLLAPLLSFGAPSADLGLGVGAAMFSGPSAAGVTVGPALKVEFAVELHERVSLSLFALGSAHRGGAALAGDGAPQGGDLTALTPGLSARVNMLGFDDALGARRVWIYARAGFGWTAWWPAGKLGSGGPLVLAALGLEYRAHLKGFSIGLEIAPYYAPTRGAFGGSVMPNLTFEL